MQQSFKIAELITKSLKGEISPDELEMLEKWKKESPENLALYDSLSNPQEQLHKIRFYEESDQERVWEKIDEKIFPKRNLFQGKAYLRIAAAILFPVILAGGFAYYYLTKQPEMTMATIDEAVLPGSQKAVLILSDGKSVVLEDDNTRKEISDRGVKITNDNNALNYSDEENRSSVPELIYNTLKTPVGGGYKLTLSDGSEVWLNAESSIKFPVDFTDSTRNVFLEGEGYFKVNHNGKPFIVSTGELDIRVLGTSFNITAYQDDPLIKTTLVEGKIKLEKHDSQGKIDISQVLEPDEQAVLNTANSNIEIARVQASHYTSWIDGKLEFSNEDLESVLKRLARWYGFEYKFNNESARKFHFTARFSNQEKISTILEMLEMTTDVEFEIKENAIVIK